MGQLRDANKRLIVLRTDDARLEASFEVSYQQLSRRARTVLVYATMIPAPAARADLISVSSGLSDAATHHALAELVDASLMYRTTGGRYSAHDLTRLFASSRLARDCAPGDVHSARRRMFTWLLDAVMAAGAWFQPGAMASRAGSLPVDSTDEAADWLRNEVENWHAALRWSSSSEGAHARVLHAVLALDWASDLLTQWDGWAEVARLGRRSAAALGDRSGEARCLGLESWALSVCTPDYGASVARARESFSLAQEIGDVGLQGWARFFEADAHRLFGHPARGLVPAQAATALFRQSDDNVAMVQSLICVGICLSLLNAHAEALRAGVRLLTHVRSAEGRPKPEHLALYNEGTALTTIGRAHRGLGNSSESVAAFDEAAKLISRTGYRRGHVIALLELATSLEVAGRPGEAGHRLREAHHLMTTLGMRRRRIRWDV